MADERSRLTNGLPSAADEYTAGQYRLAARSGLHQGQKCIYCNAGLATCILWAYGGGAACTTCLDKARSSGLQVLDHVRVQRWLQSVCWSRTGLPTWFNAVGHTIAPFMVHLHKNRGNMWMRQIGWTTLHPSPDPAPAWRAAVAAQGVTGGLADVRFTVDSRHAGTPGPVAALVQDTRRLAQASTNHLPPLVNTHLPQGVAGPREISRVEVCECLLCRLLLLDQGEPANDASTPPAVRDRDERIRLLCCTSTAAEAAQSTQIRLPNTATFWPPGAMATRHLEPWPPSRPSQAYRMEPGNPPPPGDIRGFELNVRAVAEHTARMNQADEARDNLQRRIRELAREWETRADEEIREVDEEIRNTEEEVRRLATRANELSEFVRRRGRSATAASRPIVVEDSSEDGIEL